MEAFSLAVRSCNDRDLSGFDFYQPVRSEMTPESQHMFKPLEEECTLSDTSPALPRKKSATFLKSNASSSLSAAPFFFFLFKKSSLEKVSRADVSS